MFDGSVMFNITMVPVQARNQKTNSDFLQVGDLAIIQINIMQPMTTVMNIQVRCLAGDLQEMLVPESE
jgi:hypothetical protein